MTQDFCMLGVFERVDNRMKLHFGIGWNMNLPVQREVRQYYSGGPGVAGPTGWCCQVGNWRVYGRKLHNPVVARYQKYMGKGLGWGGRHRTEVFNPFTADYSYVGRHRAECAL